MGREFLFYRNPKEVRDRLNEVVDLAKAIRNQESELVRRLKHVDRNKFYLRYGYRSLTGFCRQALKLTKINARRIVLEVRSQACEIAK